MCSNAIMIRKKGIDVEGRWTLLNARAITGDNASSNVDYERREKGKVYEYEALRALTDETQPDNSC